MGRSKWLRTPLVAVVVCAVSLTAAGAVDASVHPDDVGIATTCALGYSAPSGGGATAAPLQAIGRILCSSPGPHAGAVLNVYLEREGVTVASEHRNITGRTFLEVTVTAPCSPGRFTTLVTATTPGANLNPNLVSSAPVTITCPIVVTNPGHRISAHMQPTDRPVMTAIGGQPPYTWSATGLPTGLNINPSTGMISGYAYPPGFYTVTATARDSAGGTGTTTFTWRVENETCSWC